jgi:hypothetical protein
VFGETAAERLLGTGSAGAKALAFVALIATAAAATWVALGYREARELRSALDRIERQADLESPGPAALPARGRPTAVKHADHAGVVARLNTPWSAHFATLERTTPANVSLVSLEPDATTGRIAITAEAAQLAHLYDYGLRLTRDPGVVDVSYGRHETQLHEPNQPVRLTLLVTPRSAAR